MNKNILKRSVIIGSLLLVLTGSCEKWTYVAPTMELRQEDVFATELGVQEALNSVYTGMATSAAYCGDMTWGLVEVMGGMYDPIALTTGEQAAVGGDFSNAALETRINSSWNDVYRAVANANNLIAGIQNADPRIFTKIGKDVFHGEALGLRSLMYFDLLRLFGPVPGSVEWESTPVLPYVTIYSKEVTPRITAAAFAAKLLADISHAEALLTTDPILGAMPLEELRFRKCRFNYYAVKALQARVYLWLGDKPKALAAAQEVLVVAPNVFPFTASDEVQSDGTGTSYDFILSSETIFSLFSVNLRSFIENKLINIPFDTKGVFANHYRLSPAQQQSVYEASTVGVVDYRNIKLLDTENSTDQTFGNIINTSIVSKKLHQYLKGGGIGGAQTRPKVHAANRMPLMRISEMFYVVAECLADTDPTTALNHLNAVRTARNITTELPATLSRTELYQEIGKEYRKEFLCEGQVFYYRKRTGEIDYQLPLPQREVELGL